MADTVNYKDPKFYTNRELSWLQFNNRVLGEARDKTTLPFERLKFLSITASNLDEFFMVRVASLDEMVHAGYKKRDIAGMTAQEQLDAIGVSVHELVESQYSCYNRGLLPLMHRLGLVIIPEHEELQPAEAEFADRYFEREVYPVLTPMAVDSSRPFPLVRNKSINIGVLMQKKKSDEDLEFAMVRVPDVLPRVVEIPEEVDNLRGDPEHPKPRRIIYLEEIIERNIGKLFLNYKILCSHPFRIMRNADLSIDEDESADLLQEIEKKLKQRQRGEVIRLEIEKNSDKRLLKRLRNEFGVSKEEIYEISGPLDLTVLMKVYGLPGFEEYKMPSYKPKAVPELMNDDDIFTNIRKGDILLQHPYQTFEPVIGLIEAAAEDPDVLAIKQTLYRVSGNSPIIKALARAAERGKQVSVLVELKARFDEEHNIIWAKMLEKAGCHVIYGLVGLKTHCKITLIVRREEDGIRRYVHLGTGNYNDSTAKLYTDNGLLTCREKIGEDATAVFNMLSGYSEPLYWNRLAVAPLWLRNRFFRLIDREKANAEQGRPSGIIAKMNSLCDQEIIERLYAAGQAGVKIHLIIRGICCLKAGIPGLSENISVCSIVGNFLEHARIFRFENDGDPLFFMGSADWMPRNLDRRVEIMFPVEDERLTAKLEHYLEVQLEDNVKAQYLQPDGSYEKPDRRGRQAVCAQDVFCEEAAAAAREQEDLTDPVKTRVFVPMEGTEMR
ncbi:MAG: RNA degradosome polyphosphate kinase [Clostridium sp.]|nr:RNA degradosome polyphosphate kinase [Clostridium sp.]